MMTPNSQLQGLTPAMNRKRAKVKLTHVYWIGGGAIGGESSSPELSGIQLTDSLPVDPTYTALLVSQGSFHQR